MSYAKYTRFTSTNIGLFSWEKTKYNKIIVRDKDDGEVIVFLEQPIDQKTLIADSYQAGFKTAYSLQRNYIDFLEQMTAPLMPSYEEPEYDYPEEYNTINPDEVYITDDKDNLSAKHCVYDLYIPNILADEIVELLLQFDAQYPETFFANACSIWIEDAPKLTETDIYAAPKDGAVCRVFIEAEDHKTYKWLSHQTHHSVTDLLYTAIKEMTKLTKNFKPSNTVINLKPVSKSKDTKKPVQKRTMMTVQAASN